MTPPSGAPSPGDASREGASCPTCGEKNPERARYCLSCGATLEQQPVREVRKTVTTLFCDVVESTLLGDRADPELVRSVMSRYFDEMRAVIEHHGGTVEKFIGDEVMAVFGVPTVHEDDAVRAVRAAAEGRARLRALNEELERDFGVSLVTRMGINTGEVVAGDPSSGQTFVTGESVNLAKRLQQAAEPGEILIGTATYPLVKDAVTVGPARTVSVKGKAGPVAPRSLDVVDATAPGFAPRLDAPLVGREPELRVLFDAFEQAVRTRSARRVTVLGAAGIGKSRLALEFGAAVRDRATVLTGRCLSYGDGITFWPLSEIVRQAGGEPALGAALAGEEDAELVADRIRGTIGRSETVGGAHETFWAFRRFFEALAETRPLVVTFEDVHWAEPTLLDLIEYLVSWSRRTPMLIVCLARPDFLDSRASWATSTADAMLLELEPLSSAETEALLAGLRGDSALGSEDRARIMEAAEGNPLFVEQMAAMVAEGEARGGLTVPLSIQALLNERLDRLDRHERALIEHASVIGKEFSTAALFELLPRDHRPGAGSHLMALVRKGLLRPDASPAGGGDAFRFRHVLIRDAAYEAISKELRASLHERLADWLEHTAAGEMLELEEIVGYHLEQAFRYRQQLGPVDQRTQVLAERAGELLGAAGRRAFTRDDMPAAIKLLDRAVALLTDQHPARLELVRELSSASWAVGELARAEALLDGLLQAATGSADRRVEWYALLEREIRRNMTDPSPTGADLQEVAEGAIRVFEELGDNVGLARAWRSLAWAPRARGQFAIAEQAVARALECSLQAGDRQEEARSVDVLCSTMLNGPTAAREGIKRCRELMERAAENRLMEASVATSLAGFLAMDRAFDEARMAARRAETIYEGLGLQLPLLAWSEVMGFVELLADDPVAADRVLRRGYEMIARGGTSAVSAFQAGLLAITVLAQRRYEEADRLAAICEQASAADSIEAQVLWRRTRSLLHAHAGAFEQAIAVATEAVERGADTDALNMRGDALMTLSSVLVDARREEAAATAAAEALQLYEQKGNVVAAERAEAQRAAVRS